jgi:hypothetical protein
VRNHHVDIAQFKFVVRSYDSKFASFYGVRNHIRTLQEFFDGIGHVSGGDVIDGGVAGGVAALHRWHNAINEFVNEFALKL